MLVPVEWIREYVDFDLTTEALAERLTMAGLEVEEIKETAGQMVYSTYVTPNRPDLLSIIGVARDVSALLSTSLRSPAIEIVESDADANALASVEIKSPINCPRYSARVISGVKVTDSPKWMQDRLIAAGMRPINNVVDATNYVLLEMGQPLHAFDYDLLADHKIIVRQAEPGEKIMTLDGEERELTPNTLVIADPKHAVAVAGVMGGFDSEVSYSTKNILLESAHFNRLSIRRTARYLQLSTEASFRFERGVDPNLTVKALDRVVQLIQETGGGTIARGVIDAYPSKIEQNIVTIRPERAVKILGFHVSDEQIVEYLTSLGMIVRRDGDKFVVEVTTFRPDISREEDLIEEVGRIYGYERIPERLPSGESMQGSDSEEGRFASRVLDILVSAGLQEVATGSMSPCAIGREQVPVRNPLSDDLGYLRCNLMLDLLAIIRYNCSRGMQDVSVCQIGHIFGVQDGGAVEEKLSIAVALTGSMWGQTWNVDRTSLEVDFFFAKGIAENLLERVGVQNVRFQPAELIDFHPTRAAIIEAEGKRLGVIGQVDAKAAERYEVPGRTYAFEIDFSLLMELSGHEGKYRPLSRFPAVTRDLAVLVSADVPYERVTEIISREGGELLESLSLFDVYSGPPLPEDKKNLAFALIFRSPDRTLRDAEVDERLTRIRMILTTELGASFRDT